MAASPVVQMKGTKSFIGPTGMIAIANRFYDPYDQGDRVVEAVQNGLWTCTECGICDEVCKALEIDHLATWEGPTRRRRGGRLETRRRLASPPVPDTVRKRLPRGIELGRPATAFAGRPARRRVQHRRTRAILL